MITIAGTSHLDADDVSRHQGRSLLLEPSECIDCAESPGWLLFVLEISKNLTAGGSPAQALLNPVELCCRVFALTEPVAHERGCHHIRRLQIIALGNTERNTMTPQCGIHFIAKPCAVPEFECHAQPMPICLHKEGIKGRHVGLEIGRKLEKHHTHPSSSHHRSERTRQGGDCVRTVSESKDVSKPLRSFE